MNESYEIAINAAQAWYFSCVAYSTIDNAQISVDAISVPM
jgi:hypothetical protein